MNIVHNVEQEPHDETPSKESNHSYNFCNYWWSDFTLAHNDLEEKSVIKMEYNKYSSSKKSITGSKLPEQISSEFDEADNINFATYDEYNEEDYTFETVEEVIVEENDSEWTRFDKFRPTNVSS